uniref:Gustatory receptor n=1 Tax=Acrobeloides nanus TaxID=290746 RepID=A0A914DS75_9BILA
MAEENSAVLKLLRDPTCVKLFCAGLSLLQLLMFGSLNSNYSPILTIVISSITLLSSLLVIGLVVSKKNEVFANFRLWKCITGKVEIEWDGMYYTYVTVFGSLNLLAIVDNIIHLSENYRSTMGHIVIAILGLILTIVYFAEAYRSYDRTKTNFGDMANEVYAPTCYIRLLKLIGSFPVIMRLVILVLSVVFITLIAIGPSLFGWYWWYSSYMHCKNIFMIFAASLLVGISVVNIGFIKFKCFQAKLEKVTNKDIACCIRSGLPLAMTSISFCGFGVSLLLLGRDFITPIIAGITLVVTLLLALAESHGKMEDGDSHVVEEDQRSMLPKNLAKHIMNPVVSDQLKDQFVPDEATTGNPYNNRPLFI